ncbi:MAG TPA: SH3 domain-containing protein [Hyphomicrobiaceae bacterium]|nr:SH3 domain-containing protein [Hyphomicrobiaceae bacterium]
MQKLVAKSIGVSALCTLVVFVAPVGAAFAAEPLSGDTLRKRIPGAKIQVDTPLGSVVPVSYGADGTLEGKAGAVAFFLGSQKDRGKWWIEGSKLCQRWNTWFNKRTNCARVFRTAENRIEWIDQDGDKGTGTIVELSNPAPAASPSDEKHERQRASAPTPKSVTKPAAVPTAVARKVPPRHSPVPTSGPTHVPTPVHVSKPPAPEKRQGHQTTQPRMAASKDAAQTPRHHKPVGKSAYGATYRVVNVARDDVLNVRTGPAPTAPIVSTIRARAKGIVLVGNCTGEWCPVQLGPRQGWVNRYFLAAEHGGRRNALGGRSSRNPLTYKVVRVPAGDVLNLRRRPDAQSAVVATIPPSGNRIRLTGYCVGEWCPVAYGRQSGWAHRYFLALEF